VRGKVWVVFRVMGGSSGMEGGLGQGGVVWWMSE